MATANIGSIIARSVTSIPLYTTTTNQFNKTVFTGVTSPYTVVLPVRVINSPANVSYSTTTGEYSLTGGITYNIAIQGAPIVNYTSARPATWQWWNTTANIAIGAAVPIGSTVTLSYKPQTDQTIAVRVAAGSTPFDYPAQLDNTIRSTVTVVGGWEQ